MDATETDDESVIGEAAHIVAEKEEGPRGVSPLSREQRDKYANLLLLCSVHHKQVDDQTGAYTIDRLNQLKQAHEAWVRQQLDFDAAKLRDEILYASYVEEWACSLKLDEWNEWGSWMLSADQPRMNQERKQALDDIRPWLLSRVWPGRYPNLEDAFTNFRHVAQDLCRTFEEHAERIWNDMWQVAKFYKIDEWDPDRYSRLSAQYDDHVSLVEDLFLELTRAANYVCDKVREELLPSYRVKEGVLLVTSGPHMDLSNRTYRVEYGEKERTRRPYRGLGEFKLDRFTRDYCFGDPPASNEPES
jgi:hypothetical protein